MINKLPIKKIQGNRFLQFFRFLISRAEQLDITRVSSSLTFTTLLAMVPFFTIALIVISAFPMFSDITEGFNDFITNTLMPDASAKIIGEYVYSFRDKASNLTAIGIIALAISAILLIMTIERTFNQIWQVSRPRPLVKRLLIYWAVLTLGPVAIGVATSSWALLLKESNFAFYYPIAAKLIQIVSSIIFTTFALFLLYRFVPSAYVPMTHALVGAAITAIILETIRRGFTYYVSNFNSYELIYGAFATIPIFLLWLNLLWLILLLGAVLTASLSYWKGSVFLFKNNPAKIYEDALTTLILLHEAQNKKTAMRTQDFRQYVDLGFDEIGDLLENLANLNYIEESSSGWILKTNAANINIGKLFEEFVYYPEETAPQYINKKITELMRPGLQNLDMSLMQFIKETNQT